MPSDVLELLAAHTYLILLGLLFIEEAGVPLPISGDLLLVMTGYYVSKGQINPLVSVLAIEASCLAGTSIPYLLGRSGGHAFLVRYGRYIHLSQSRVDTVERWLQRHGGLAIVVGRLIPGGRVATSLLAGTFEIGYRRFLAYTALGTLLWAGSFIFIGYLTGRNLGRLKWLLEVRPVVSTVVFGAILVALAFTLYIIVSSRRRGRKLPSE